MVEILEANLVWCSNGELQIYKATEHKVGDAQSSGRIVITLPSHLMIHINFATFNTKK